MAEKSGGCGEAAIGCLLLFIVVVVGGYFWLRDSKQKEDAAYQRQLQARSSKIPLSSVSVIDPRLALGDFPRLTGRVANASRDSISIVYINVTIFDCTSARTELPKCTVVASDKVSAVETVPPSQARDFDAHLTLPSALQIRGHMQWTYAVVGVLSVSP
ncbi:MAG TPA: hypothetical protein VNH14_12810 [Gemmatimonadales bacterium]|nr:hypothetical protein [Gemmatimonadales bacterium]